MRFVCCWWWCVVWWWTWASSSSRRRGGGVLSFSPSPSTTILRRRDVVLVRRAPITARETIRAASTTAVESSRDDDDDGSYESVEAVLDDDVDDDDDDWVSDRERLRRAVHAPGGEASTNRRRTDGDGDGGVPRPFKSAGVAVAPPRRGSSSLSVDRDNVDVDDVDREFVYSDEEEELIHVLGGKGRDDNDDVDEGRARTSSSGRREPGYLGDCTIEEIAADYSVPACWIADVLAGWDCPLPIVVRGVPLGDVVTGEQAFALLEALHTLDLGDLYDRYSDDDVATVCEHNDVDLKEAFDFCVKEGYHLPFGVRTNLRVEQEEELLRVLAKQDW